MKLAEGIFPISEFSLERLKKQSRKSKKNSNSLERHTTELNQSFTLFWNTYRKEISEMKPADQCVFNRNCFILNASTEFPRFKGKNIELKIVDGKFMALACF
jgi:hypothetical protein